MQSNWAGNYVYRARRIHRPTSLEQLSEVVAGAERVRVLGSRHSFTDIADSRELLVLDRLPLQVTVDEPGGGVGAGAGISPGAGTGPGAGVRDGLRIVTVPGVLTYAQLARELERAELALPAMASLPHISVAGAVATATHGSGNRFGNLATAVCGIELVRSDGTLLTLGRGDPDFEGAVVGLGALGAVTRLTLAVEPAYQVAQRVYEGMAWETLQENFDAVMAAADSVSVFSLWGEQVDQVWLKSRVRGGDAVALDGHAAAGDWAPSGIAPAVGEPLLDAAAMTDDTHPISGQDPVNCNPQLGVPGLWSERLPHFRAGFVPSAGNEIQSEWFIPREHAIPAIEAMRAIGGQLAPLLQVAEIRTIAADQLWMSMHYERDSVAFHFTWYRQPEQVRRAVALVERALQPFAARPHWAKLFLQAPLTGPAAYPRRADFIALTERLDPRGAFRNEWFERVVLG